MKLIDLIDIQPQTTKWLYDLDFKGLLEVDNTFQRNYVWTARNQIKLVESIVMGSPIPEIYLWNTGTDENTGDTKYSIIDGQQRCGAIFQYIANNYKLKESLLDNKNHRKEYVKDRLFKDLEVEDKKAIWSYVFSIRIVKNQVERDSIVDMFLRLNSNNLTLNPQELRNAEFIGEFMKVSEYLSGLKFWDDNKLFGIADRRRMRDISFVSTLLVFLKEGIEGDISNESLNRIYDLYNDEYPDKENDISIFKSIIKDIGRIIDNKNERIKILKRTVHFYSLFTVLYELTITDELLSDFHIKNYRNFIDNYNNDELLDKYYPNSISEIFSYKALVKEGTRQKFNRTQRHNNLLKIMKYDADI